MKYFASFLLFFSLTYATINSMELPIPEATQSKESAQPAPTKADNDTQETTSKAKDTEEQEAEEPETTETPEDTQEEAAKPEAKPEEEQPDKTIKKEQKELNEIHQSMQTMDQHKDAMKAQLKELDAKLEEAHNKASQAKQQSFDILKQDDVKQAEKIFNQIRATLKEIKKTQQNLQGDFTKTFHEKVGLIKVEIAKINKSLENLKELKPVAEFNPEEEPAQEAEPGSAQTVQQQPVIPKRKSTIISKINTALAHATAYTIASMKKAKNWFTSPSSTQQSKKKPLTVQTDQFDHSKERETADEQGVKEIGSSDVSNPMPLVDRVKDKIEKAQERVKEFEDMSLEMHKIYKQIKKEMKIVKTKAYSIPVIRAFLIFKFQASPFYKNVKWRRGIEHLFSKFLDLLVIITYSSARVVKKTYNYLLADHIDRFVSDVHKKIKLMERDKNEDEEIEKSGLQKQE